jgi:hypothetical protein
MVSGSIKVIGNVHYVMTMINYLKVKNSSGKEGICNKAYRIHVLKRVTIACRRAFLPQQFPQFYLSITKKAASFSCGTSGPGTTPGNI